MRFILLWVGVGIYSASAWAALSPASFFCIEAPLFQDYSKASDPGPLITHSIETKSCPGAKGAAATVKSESDVCTMVVPCAYMTDEVKASAEKMSQTLLQKSFSKLTNTQQTDIMNRLDNQTRSDPVLYAGGVEYLQSVLTCPAIKDGKGVLTCPLPRDCKGDELLSVRKASFSADDRNTVKSGVITNTEENFTLVPSGSSQ